MGILPPQGSPTLGSETVGGDTYTVQRHELAVYPQRAGAVRLPPIGVRFATDAGIGKSPIPRQGATKEMTFTAKMPPGAEGLSTVITTPNLTVLETWKPEPGKARLGAAFTRTVTVRARDVPGMVLPAMRWPAPEGLAIYPGPPAVTDATERGESTGQRVETITYICVMPGTVTIPGLTLTWWDPGEKKLKRAGLPARTLEVTGDPGPAHDIPDDAPAGRSGMPAWALVLAALFLAFLGLLWLVRARLRSSWQRYRLARSTSERACFARFRRACRVGDARAIYQALTAWLVATPLDEFAARSGDAELAAQLCGLQAQLYGRPQGERPARWSAEELCRRVSRARRHLLRTHRASSERAGGLAPLNPVGEGGGADGLESRL